MAKLSDERTKSPARWWWAGALAVVLLMLAGALLVGLTPLGRLIHPHRYAVTGERLLPLSAYPGAARRVLAADDRIGALTLPDGRGPIVVTARRAATADGGRARDRIVYLDPPTARVLDSVDDGPGWIDRWTRDPIADQRPLSRTGQPVGAVVASAAALANGARLQAVAWPTVRSPDWTVRFAGGATVKVADDRPGATAVRVHTGTSIGRANRFEMAGKAALVVGALLVALAATLWWRAAGRHRD